MYKKQNLLLNLGAITRFRLKKISTKFYVKLNLI